MTRLVLLALIALALQGCADPAPKPFERGEEVLAPEGCLDMRKRTGDPKAC